MAENLFAILDDNSVVIDIVVGNPTDLFTEQQMASFQGVDVSKVKEYSEDGTYQNRGVAGKGMTYVPGDDYFKAVQPFASWTYNDAERVWKAPITEPKAFEETYNYWWNEENQRWMGYPCTGAPDYNPSEDPRIDYIWNTTSQAWENQ